MKPNLKLGLLALLALAGVAGAIKPGDTRTAVVEELGAPTSTIRLGKEETLYYERGRVQLLDGKVASFEIISPEQLRERQAAAEKARAEQAARLAQWRAQLKLEGEAALKQLLADPAFVSATAAMQVARWREFMRKYPDVPVTGYYLPALKRLEEEQTSQAQEQRIASLEQRVQDAEQRVLMNDTRKMQYPSVYIIQPSVWYRPPCGTEGLPRRDHLHGPQRGNVTGGVSIGGRFSF